jgi:serine/threonine-protein kinase
VPRLSASASEAANEGPATGNKVLVREGDLIADRYRLVEKIGSGGMGEVWRARHRELHNDVAIKLATRAASSDMCERLLSRFRFEAQVSAQLSRDCEHLVAVHDVGSHEGVAYSVMEYVPGASLDSLIVEHGRVGVERMADVVEQLAVALEAAHAAGIWHRDIKPANILVGARNGRDFVKLADFGVAKAIEVRLDVDTPHTTEWGILVGTPTYMSPEQIAGITLDARSDLWSLAVCAYEALTGDPPFDDDRELQELLVAIATQPFVPPSQRAELPATLDRWFERALNKKPEERFGSAREMAAAFREALAPPRKRRMPPRWTLAVIVVLAAAAIAVGLSLGRNDGEDAPASVTHNEPTPAPPRPESTATERAPTRTTAPTPPSANPGASNPMPKQPSKPASSAAPSPSSSGYAYDDAETL